MHPLKIVAVGHVDHGKSTLVGRLLYETNSLPEGKIEAIHEMCLRRGMPFEWAFVMDALKVERDQGITVDVAHIQFRVEDRRYILIDAPGHHEFLKNMVTGAASADAAVLVIDTKEGVREQTRRHGYLLHLLGIRQVAVILNKMDLVGWSKERYLEVTAECRNYLSQLGLNEGNVFFIPASAREGDGIIQTRKRLSWYDGPTLIEALKAFQPLPSSAALPLRLPVQDVYKFDERRIIAGRIESGRLVVGEEVLFSPSNKKARVASIEGWPASAEGLSAHAGQSVGITLEGPLFIERGEVISHVEEPPKLTDVFKARLFWLGRNPLRAGNRYRLKVNTADYVVQAEHIERVIDVSDLRAAPGDHAERNTVAEVVFRCRELMALDEFAPTIRTGRFVLVEEYDVVGGGLISTEGYPDRRPRPTVIKSSNITRIKHRVELEDRWERNGHRGGILWFTGLSGSGKSTLSFLLEQSLFERGYQVYVLDGDNLRHGLCSDLGFSSEERTENIRRVGEAAKLFGEAGFLVITAFISPYRSDRDRVRSIAQGIFHEVYIRASLAACERRDPKGLYAKARRGEIPEFTGISAPYEVPADPELVVDTESRSVDDCLADLMQYVMCNVPLLKPIGAGG